MWKKTAMARLNIDILFPLSHKGVK